MLYVASWSWWNIVSFHCLLYHSVLIKRNGMTLKEHPFLPSSAMVVSVEVLSESRTWEEALEYCRAHHDDLASVAPKTDVLLNQRELPKHNTTEHIWIGLCFLSRDWLWVDRQVMDYAAWGEGGKPWCPHAKMKWTEGVWGAHDCEEKLNFLCFIHRYKICNDKLSEL
uniref:C-type lectin domain-containing protein n=1 Tax=Neolamprologus brichardi TaxID=32507 RepID=A0A3Q4I532_NEOBR